MTIKTENDQHGNHWVQLEIPEISYIARKQDPNMRPHILWPILLKEVYVYLNDTYITPLKDCADHVRMIRGDDDFGDLLFNYFKNLIIYDPTVVGHRVSPRIVPYDNTTKILVWRSQEDIFTYPGTWVGHNYPTTLQGFHMGSSYNFPSVNSQHTDLIVLRTFKELEDFIKTHCKPKPKTCGCN